MEWGLSGELSPEQLAAREASLQPIRDRARRRLDRARHQLPQLTDDQVEIIVMMMVDAYEAGDHEQAAVQDQERYVEMQKRLDKAVSARRRQSKRHAIIAAFKASNGRDVSIEQLAKDHGVSRSTAYRAINMIGKKSTPKPKR